METKGDGIFVADLVVLAIILFDKLFYWSCFREYAFHRCICSQGLTWVRYTAKAQGVSFTNSLSYLAWNNFRKYEVKLHMVWDCGC